MNLYFGWLQKVQREKRKIVSNFVLESKVTFLRFIKSSVSFPYPKCQSESRVKHRRALKRYILHLENLDLSFNFWKKFLSIEVEKWLPPFYSCWRGLKFLYCEKAKEIWQNIQLISCLLNNWSTTGILVKVFLTFFFQ